MHVGVDLGFRSVVVLACFLVPVIGFFVARHKWRLAAARTEEIKRLLALASEEAARAEFEVTAGYDVVSTAAFENRDSVCAVCYCPTTTRCARCKAVRYCSGKCQIIHWRQGHRENCQPAQIVDPYVDERSDDGQKVSKKNLESNADKHEGRQSTESFSEEPAVPNSGCPPEVHCIKDEDSEDEFLADRKDTNSPSGSSATSFSGFSTCASSNGSSDDVSVSESVSSFEPDRTDGHQSANDVLDMLHTSFSADQIDQSKPLSPKFASLIDSVDGFTKPSKSNQVKANCNDGKEEQRSKSSSGVNHNDTSAVPVTESRTISSDFWGRTLDSFRSDSDDHLSDSSDSSESKISHSGSYLHLSFKPSPAPPLHTVVSGSSGSLSDDALPDSTGLNKSVYRDELLEKTSEEVAKGKNSPLNFEGFTNKDNGPGSKLYAFNSTETKSQPFFSSNGHKSLSSDRVLRSSDVLHSSGLMPTSLKNSNHIAINCSKSLKSTAGGQISAVSNARFPSDVRGSSVPSVKSGNGDCIEAGDAVSSQVTKSSNDGTGSKTSVFKVFDQFRGSKISKHCPLGVGTEIAGKHAEKELFPYEVFVKLYNWNKVELHPSGLLNCGNSCYANAVLQCLAFTPPLTAYLLQGLHSKSCAKKDWCFMCEFESLILKAKEGKSPLSPIRILSQLRDNGSQLGNGREEDAHEFLRYAIDTMQSVCLTEAGVNASRPLKEETTLIGLTFGGYLRSKIKCSRCQGKSERQERMMDLTVEIEGDIGTLEEALRRFTGTEILDGENKYQCSRCKSYEKAKKKLTILEAPNVLTIALKRFQSGKFGKINKPIRFPEILDLAPYMSGTSDKSPIYKLYGVIVHLDVMNAAFSGHYVCYVKNLQNKWFKIDDSMVTAVDLGNVLEKGAYMLLYSRCSARAPRLIRNRMISSDPKHRAIPSWITGKSTNLKPKSLPTHPSVAQFSSSKPPENSTSYPPLQRISEEDLSSDNASLVSSRSDEGSSSTDSTRYSSSTDDFSDYIFGDSGHEYNSPWRTSSDSDTSSSSSPSSSKHSPLSDLNRYASSSTETISLWDGRPIGVSRRFVDSGGKVSDSFLNSDITIQFRKLANSSSSSRYKGADSERLGVNSLSNVKSRKSNCE